VSPRRHTSNDGGRERTGAVGETAMSPFGSGGHRVRAAAVDNGTVWRDPAARPGSIAEHDVAHDDGRPSSITDTTRDGTHNGRPNSISDPKRDWAHEYGTAFVELLAHLPTDRLSGKVAATVVVTIDHDQLREQLGAAHLDTGHDLSAAEARRLACSAGVLPAVLDGSSLPLNLGRTKRFFTEAQRVALATTYDQCAAEHCDRPYAWTDLHHEDPWSKGGSTDLHLGVPLCGPHHRRAHDARYEHVINTDGSGRQAVSFHTRT